MKQNRNFDSLRLNFTNSCVLKKKRYLNNCALRATGDRPLLSRLKKKTFRKVSQSKLSSAQVSVGGTTSKSEVWSLNHIYFLWLFMIKVRGQNFWPLVPRICKLSKLKSRVVCCLHDQSITPSEKMLVWPCRNEPASRWCPATCLECPEPSQKLRSIQIVRFRHLWLPPKKLENSPTTLIGSRSLATIVLDHTVHAVA